MTKLLYKRLNATDNILPTIKATTSTWFDWQSVQ